jgi:hypothetical protein
MMERSKVIRLGPEAEALKQAIAAPATPAPVLTNPRGKTVNLADPGPTPPARSLTPGRTPVARSFTPARTPVARSFTPGRTPVARSLTPGRTPVARSLTPGRTPAARNLTPPRTPAARNLTPPHTPAARAPSPARPAEPRASGRPAPDPMATPLPTTPLPPARARGHTPLKSASSDLTPRATPPQPQNVEGRNPTMLGRPAPNRQKSQSGAQQWPIPGSSQSGSHAGSQPGSPSTTRGPATTDRRPSNPMPVVAGHRPQPSPVGTRQTGPRNEVQPATPAYGVQRPPPRDFALAQTMLPHGGGLPGAMGGHPAPVPRQHHETARVQFRPQRQWGGVFMVIVLLLVAAGVGVHLWLIPLDVLITWRQPTGLSITTEPPGAKLRVDGVPLAATAPTTVTVWRDRTDHTVEATLVGYQLARETIRYDKAATLSYVVRLLKDPNYIPPPPAPPAAPPAAPSTGPPP